MSRDSELDAKALLKRLQALEAENEKLKVANVQSPSSLVVVETEYRGHPMLEFRLGNARPFSLGVKKLQAIQDSWDQVQSFLKRHGEGKDSEQI
jgi:hypothetical protein